VDLRQIRAHLESIEILVKLLRFGRVGQRRNLNQVRTLGFGKPFGLLISNSASCFLCRSSPFPLAFFPSFFLLALLSGSSFDLRLNFFQNSAITLNSREVYPLLSLIKPFSSLICNFHFTSFLLGVPNFAKFLVNFLLGFKFFFFFFIIVTIFDLKFWV
jgi:hypothetical protein